jgi:hypothetical protein
MKEGAFNKLMLPTDIVQDKTRKQKEKKPDDIALQACRASKRKKFLPVIDAVSAGDARLSLTLNRKQKIS